MALVISGIMSGICLFINVRLTGGWPWMGMIEMAVLTITFGLFASVSHPNQLRFGILVYALSTGVLVIAKSHPALMGEFEFQPSLGPFANNVGLLCGLPWFLVIMLSFPLAARLSEKIYLRALLGGILVAVPSYFIMANGEMLNFFYWPSGAIPVQAYILWFGTGFLSHFAGHLLQVRSDNAAGAGLYANWVVYLIVLFVAGLFA